jgi:uncharacterized protein (TIGR02001 family)
VVRYVSAHASRKGLICRPMNDLVRLPAALLLLLSLCICQSQSCKAADVWGGSLGITNDYVVRGLSRTDHQGALQLDLHYLNTSGFLAGVFASNAELDPGEGRDAEIDGFVGFAWTATENIRGKILASHYAYPWNKAGNRYDYDEIEVDVAYRDWLDVNLMVSPDAPRYSRARGLRSATAGSLEVDLQHSVVGKLSATAGLGYYALSGVTAGSSGYAYWSLGAAYDLAPVLLTLTYVGTESQAKALFYNAAERGRWAGTVIWRF